MSGTIFFTSYCPRCSYHGIFKVLASSAENQPAVIEKVHHGQWRTFDFGLFSISSFCEGCKNYVCATVSVKNDEIKNSTASLNDFADSSLQLKANQNLFIEFDVPVLIPPQNFSSPPVVNILDLFEQAKKCYSLGAWDSVGVICRKIIDIESIKMWELRHPKKKPARTLAARLEKLLIKNISRNKSIDIRDQLDYEKIEHRLFYDMHNIRLTGNDAAHSLMLYHDDEAESALTYTESFLKLSEQWADSFCKS
ncbi:hypothetical protein [Pseudomonas sp. SDO52101_S400]